MSRAKIPLLSLLALLLILGACQSEGKIEGEVFIVTEGRDNIEMGLVEVKAIKAPVLDKHLSNRFDTAQNRVRDYAEEAAVLLDSLAVISDKFGRWQERYRNMQSSLQNLQNEYSRAEDEVMSPLTALVDDAHVRVEKGPSKGDEVATYDQTNVLGSVKNKDDIIKKLKPGIFGRIIDVNKTFDYYKIDFPETEGWVYAYNIVPASKYRKYSKRNKDARIKKGKLLEELNSLRREVKNIKIKYQDTRKNRGILEDRVYAILDSVRNYRKESFFFKGMSEPIDSDETGSDGNFEITVGRGKDYYLVAQAERSTGINKEKYYWIAKVELDRRKKEVILSNKNLGYLQNKGYAQSEMVRDMVGKVWSSAVEYAKKGKANLNWEKLIYRTAFPQDTTDVPIPDELDVSEEKLLSNR